MTKIMISETGEIHGRGSMRAKWVSRLTDAERSHVREGGIVLIRDTGATRPNQCGWKRVKYRGGQYYHREATPEQMREIENWLVKKWKTWGLRRLTEEQTTTQTGR